MPFDDPFRKLRVPAPIPPDEICACVDAPPILLRYTFSPCPLACARCNLELQPEVIAPSTELVDSLASWREFYGAFYTLWLDSAEFEQWARIHLSDPTGPVNARGLALRRQLESNHRKTYYWWFQDTGAGDFESLTACPICNSTLTDCGLVGLACAGCSVLVANRGWGV